MSRTAARPAYCGHFSEKNCLAKQKKLDRKGNAKHLERDKSSVRDVMSKESIIVQGERLKQKVGQVFLGVFVYLLSLCGIKTDKHQ
jgi:hypothetical protein